MDVEIENQLKDTLPRLYDPGHVPGEALATVLSIPRQPGSAREPLIAAIEAMRPAPDVPPEAPVWRVYTLLSARYISLKTQAETALLLGITTRHLRRQQNRAIHALAAHLQREYDGAVARDASPPTTPEQAPPSEAAWQSQVREEVEALQRSAPSAVCDVRETLQSVADLVQPLALERGVSVDLAEPVLEMHVAIHPSALRQILVSCLTDLIKAPDTKGIRIEALPQGEQIAIEIRAQPAAAPMSPAPLVQELLAAAIGSCALECTDGGQGLCLRLPTASPITVLVVDDNTDLLHVYRRYVEGTHYEVANPTIHEDLFAAIARLQAQIVVLDIMLPDVDGWDLLTQLHEQPDTRDIPVVVCSVVREHELAMALGAASMLSKPVRRSAFIAALDHALALVRSRAEAAHGRASRAG